MSAGPLSTRRYHIRGKVQGVCFRAATRDAARALGIVGWVRNRTDGTVEVLAAGTAAALQAFAAWLAQGPPRARVDAVLSETCDEAVGSGFEVR